MTRPEGFIPLQQIPSAAVPFPQQERCAQINIVSPTLLTGGAENMARELHAALGKLGYDVALHDASRGPVDVSGGLCTIWWGRVFEGRKPPGSIYVAHSPGGSVPADVEACLPDIDTLVGVSEQCVEKWGGKVIPNGIDPAPWEHVNRLRGRNMFVVGYFGRYEPEKNPIKAVEVLAQLPNKFILATHGSGRLHSAIEAAAERLGVTERVVVGHEEHPIRAMESFDCLLVTSDFEGCPMAVIEAMHAGVPVVAGGEWTQIEPFVNRLIGSNGQVKDLASAVEYTESARAVISRGRELHRAYAREHLTAERMAKDYAHLIDGFLAAPAADAPPQVACPRRRVVCAVDRVGWAFYNIAAQIRRLLRDEYDVEIVAYRDIADQHLQLECDVLVGFWWEGLNDVRALVKADRVVVCLYDMYSWRQQPDKLREVLFSVDAVAVANPQVQEALEAMGWDLPPVYVVPDGVDLDMFPEQHLPQDFALGWCGNSDPTASIDGVEVDDLKGLRLIQEACERTDTALLVQDVSREKEVPHHRMAERFYRQISAYVCMSSEEGGPNTCKEAMACGRPVITTAVGDMPAMIDGSDAGIIVGRSVRELASAIDALKSDDLYRRKAAALRQAKRWAWPEVIGAWRDCLSCEPRDKSMSDLITAFVITTGEPSTSDCIGRLGAQTRKVKIEMIRDVTPMWRAFQEMHDRCETPFFIQVDADMLLDPDAVERLYLGITRQESRCAQYTEWLWGDAEDRPIMGVKIYRHRIVSEFPYTDGLSCEQTQFEAVQEGGYDVTGAPPAWKREQCLGLHYSCQTPAMAYQRWKRLMFKLRGKPEYMGWLTPYPRKMLERYRKDPTEINAAIMQGVITGLGSDMPPDQELDASQPDTSVARLSHYLDSEATAGPRELNLYLTSKCIHECGFCLRQGEGWRGAPDLELHTLKDALRLFPTIRSVCFAGFGEPLMHKDLGPLFDFCNDAGLTTGLITNGALLAEKIEEVKRWRPGHVSVSLNAMDKDQHMRVTGKDTWDQVLDGCAAVKAAGIPLYASFVVGRSVSKMVHKMIEAGRKAGADAIHLHNVLPHSPDYEREVLTADCGQMKWVEYCRTEAMGGQKVSWPVPVGDPADCPRSCKSPFVSLGVDGNGSVTPCRRVLPPDVEKHGGLYWPMLWWSKSFGRFRGAMLGDLALPDVCGQCFGGWSC